MKITQTAIISNDPEERENSISSMAQFFAKEYEKCTGIYLCWKKFTQKAEAYYNKIELLCGGRD